MEEKKAENRAKTMNLASAFEKAKDQIGHEEIEEEGNEWQNIIADHASWLVGQLKTQRETEGDVLFKFLNEPEKP